MKQNELYVTEIYKSDTPEARKAAVQRAVTHWLLRRLTAPAGPEDGGTDGVAR